MSAVRTLGLVDDAVPGSATIGDEVVLRGLLREAGEDLIDRGYLRYKPATSLVAALRLGSGPAFAYAVSAAARPKVTKLFDRAPRGSVLCHLPDQGVLIARPAADRDLPALAVPGALTPFLPPGAAPDSWHPLAYKPQRRWVGSAQVGSSARVVRAYRPAELSAVLPGWQLAGRIAEQQPGVRLPEPLRHSGRRGVLAVSWLDGEPLDRLLTAGTASDDVLRGVGAGLARVHDALGRRPDSQLTSGVVRSAERVAQEVGFLLPEQRGRALGLVRRLAGRAPRTGWSHPVHADFSADQVVVAADGAIGFADWDRGRWGDPAADLGSLWAAGLPSAAYQQVLAGYRSVRAVPGALGWYAAAATALRLTDPLRRCQPAWQADVLDRIRRLERLLDAPDGSDQVTAAEHLVPESGR